MNEQKPIVCAVCKRKLAMNEAAGIGEIMMVLGCHRLDAYCTCNCGNAVPVVITIEGKQVVVRGMR